MDVDRSLLEFRRVFIAAATQFSLLDDLLEIYSSLRRCICVIA